jgi:PAS domain S-box-containing protein
MNDLLDSVPCGLITFASDGIVHMINATLLRMLGLQREEVAGRPFHHFLSRGSRIFYQTHLFPLLKMRGEIEEIYLSLLAKDGGEIPMLMNARTRGEDIGSSTLHDCVLVRVRQRAQFESALLNEKKKAQQASKAKDDFLAALSHELRTPLNPMLLLSTEMELDETLPQQARMQAGIIRSNAELEARLIDDLLDLTRIAHGKFHLLQSVTSLHDLLVLTEDIARGDSSAKRIRLRFTQEAADHYMECDSARMQQVFWNLLKNAIKFTPEGGEIHVTTHNAAPGRITVSVTDTGIGIAAEALPRIFQAFDQGSISTQRFGGLGLGLAIAKSIVEMHAGTIAVTSPGVGQGATFTVEFATCTPPAAVAPRVVSATAVPSLRLLLVEDHESTREVLARILRRFGHEVHVARDGAEALRLAAEVENFSAVISDIGLPDQSGLDLMRQLKERHGLPGIALSGYGMEEDLKNARAAGFFAHLVKPIVLDQLRALLSQVASGEMG